MIRHVQREPSTVAPSPTI